MGENCTISRAESICSALHLLTCGKLLQVLTEKLSGYFYATDTILRKKSPWRMFQPMWFFSRKFPKSLADQSYIIRATFTKKQVKKLFQDSGSFEPRGVLAYDSECATLEYALVQKEGSKWKWHTHPLQQRLQQ